MNGSGGEGGWGRNRVRVRTGSCPWHEIYEKIKKKEKNLFLVKGKIKQKKESKKKENDIIFSVFVKWFTKHCF